LLMDIVFAVYLSLNKGLMMSEVTVMDKDCIKLSKVDNPADISPTTITKPTPTENLVTTYVGIISSIFKAVPFTIKSGKLIRAYNPTMTTKKKMTINAIPLNKYVLTLLESFNNKDLVM